MAIWQTSLLARRGIYPHSVYQFSIRPHIAPESLRIRTESRWSARAQRRMAAKNIDSHRFGL